jgi:hypothetical protein
MVISQKASEKNVGNRGSKSVAYLTTVKEQRVDGNWCVVKTHLRYTLSGFERNSQIKNPSNQIKQIRLYSAKKADHGNNTSVNNLPETNGLTLLSISTLTYTKSILFQSKPYIFLLFICVINLMAEFLFFILFMVLLQNLLQEDIVQEYLEVSFCVFYLGVDELSTYRLTQRSYSTQNTPVVPSPILTYNNPDLDKLEILKENKGKAGVYR